MNDPRLTPTGKGCLNPTYVTQAPITIDNTPARLDPADLRTVPMPDLRTPDAEARDLRTAGDKLAELTQDMRRLSLDLALRRVAIGRTVFVSRCDATVVLASIQARTPETGLDQGER